MEFHETLLHINSCSLSFDTLFSLFDKCNHRILQNIYSDNYGKVRKQSHTIAINRDFL